MTRTTIRSEDITAGQVKAADLASDAVDTTGIQTDIAILGFKVAANGSLAKYDLVDQTIDAFEDATGVDASGSTNELRNASNYYIGGVSVSGGSAAFTSTGASTWTAPTPSPSSIEVLITAGGGSGGGKYYAAGGGAGGVVHAATYSVTAGVVYDLTVGVGGGAASSTVGNDGSDSVFNVNAEGSGITMTAVGGGGGGYGTGSNSGNGRAGGSGGGGAEYGTVRTGGASTQGAVSGATVYGNAGGNGYENNNNYSASGGGGATQAGRWADATDGRGGAGKLFSNFTGYGTTSGNVASSGSDGGYFAGGGGGAGYSQAPSSGGVGGGGTSSRGNPADDATAGLANTGGGGGGGCHTSTPSGFAGGSGFVGIYYASSTSVLDLTLISNATTAEAVPTKGDLVMTYTNGAGTATVNTDIKGWVSRDNGTTYTQFTLTDDGDTGGHTILTAHDLDISGQPSGSAMRYKVTTHNQSVSKETRIQAVSLGWS